MSDRFVNELEGDSMVLNCSIRENLSCANEDVNEAAQEDGHVDSFDCVSNKGKDSVNDLPDKKGVFSG